jgi:hypothetical protein
MQSSRVAQCSPRRERHTPLLHSAEQQSSALWQVPMFPLRHPPHVGPAEAVARHDNPRQQSSSAAHGLPGQGKHALAEQRFEQHGRPSNKHPCPKSGRPHCPSQATRPAGQRSFFRLRLRRRFFLAAASSRSAKDSNGVRPPAKRARRARRELSPPRDRLRASKAAGSMGMPFRITSETGDGQAKRSPHAAYGLGACLGIPEIRYMRLLGPPGVPEAGDAIMMNDGSSPGGRPSRRCRLPPAATGTRGARNASIRALQSWTSTP